MFHDAYWAQDLQTSVLCNIKYLSREMTSSVWDVRNSWGTVLQSSADNVTNLSVDSPCVREFLFPYRPTRGTGKNTVCINPQFTPKWSFLFVLKSYVCVFFLFSVCVQHELHTPPSDVVTLNCILQILQIDLASRLTSFSAIVEPEVKWISKWMLSNLDSVFPITIKLRTGQTRNCGSILVTV